MLFSFIFNVSRCIFNSFLKLEVCKQDALKHQTDKIGELKLKPCSFPVAQISLSRNKKPSLFFFLKGLDYIATLGVWQVSANH